MLLSGSGGGRTTALARELRRVIDEEGLQVFFVIADPSADGGGDLLDEEWRQRVEGLAEAGRFQAVFGIPPGATWSGTRHLPGSARPLRPRAASPRRSLAEGKSAVPS